MFKLKNILENKLFKTFVLFSVFRAIYGALVLFISYFLSTSYDDGILFTISVSYTHLTLPTKA